LIVAVNGLPARDDRLERVVMQTVEITRTSLGVLVVGILLSPADEAAWRC
jgi:hypothetical protein